MNYNKVFVEISASGHRIEYVQNLVSYVVKNNISGIYFYLSPDFKNKINGLDLLDCVLYFPEYNYLSKTRLLKLYKYFLIFRKVSFFLKANKIDSITFLFLNEFYYYLLTTKLNAKVSGIYFHTNFRKEQNLSLMSRYKEKLLFKMVVKNKIDRIYVLNDERCAENYNEITHSNVFSHLTDPVVSFSGLDSLYELKKLEQVYSTKKINVLHAGVLGARKGTDIFILSLNMLPKKFVGSFRFFLIGAPEKNFIKKLNILIDEIDNDIDFIFIPKFISNSELQAYIEFSDAVSLPYRNVESSSGMIVRSKIENKFIIAPGLGLVGDLLKDYSYFIPMSSYDLHDMSTLYQNLLLRTENKLTNCSPESELNSKLFLDDYINRVNPNVFSQRLIDDE
ncbi:hypothetical protein ACRN9C_08860 [Shewanella frigidimarina]|uniref:hypothetical protein n=1 Tax=Shewanella frigidimarina TaxID=56812 RepID=UPI003D7B2F3C